MALPAYRIPYDIDDTVVRVLDLDIKTYVPLSAQYQRRINDEFYSTSQTVKISKTKPGVTSLLFMFKQPIDLQAYKLYAKFEGVSANIQFNSFSQKTSNGFNGVWGEQYPLDNNSLTTIKDTFSTGFTEMIQDNVRAIRFNFGMASTASYVEIGALHLYANPDELALRQLAICDQNGEIAGPDYFALGLPSTQETTVIPFRVKNVSDKKATQIKVLMDVPTETSPSVMSQHKISANNTTWSNSLTLSSGNVALTLQPGQVSDVLYFRRKTGNTVSSNPYAGKIFATCKLV